MLLKKKNSLGEVTNILARTSFSANWVYLSVSMQTHKGMLERKGKPTDRMPRHKSLCITNEICILPKAKFLATEFGA